MPIGVLPAKSLIQYGNVIFPVAHRISCSSTVIRDDAGRTTKWVEHVFTITADVTANGVFGGQVPTGPHLTPIYNTLTTPALPLAITGTGFPPVIVNAGDYEWGPFPKLIGWQPLAGPLACRVTWTVKVCLPPCTPSVGRNVAAYGYSVNYAITRGYTTRVVQSYLELGMSRVPGTRQIPDTADNYRNLVVPNVPTGFMREGTSENLSMDKRRIDVTFIDKQIESENPYPGSVVEIDFSVSYRNRREKTDVNWLVDMSATIEVPLGMNHRFAYTVFAAHCQAVIQSIRNKNAQALVLPQIIHVDEPVYGKKCQMAMTMMVVKAESNILTLSGYGDAMHNGGWGAWRTSMQNANTFHERGYCQLQHNPADDIIIDLCGGTPVTPQEDCVNSATIETIFGEVILVPKPTEGSSFIKTGVDVVPIRKDHLAKHNILQAFNESDSNLPQYSNTGETRGTIMGLGTGTNAILQSTSNPDSKVGLSYDILRAGFKISPPTLVSVGGKTAHRLESIGGGNTLVDKIGEIPIYHSTGMVLYDLENTPNAEVSPITSHELSGASVMFNNVIGSTGANTPRG